MVINKALQKLNLHFSYPSNPNTAISGFKNRWIYNNEFYYICSIPDNGIVYQKGLEDLGYNVKSGDCILDPDISYDCIYNIDREDVEFISNFVLDPQNILEFVDHSLWVDYRAIRNGTSLVRISRECEIIAFDNESKSPSHYLTRGTLHEGVNFNKGVRFSVQSFSRGRPKPKGENSFSNKLTKAYNRWKSGRCPLTSSSFDTIRLIAKGYSPKEIAEINNKSLHTINGHIKNAKVSARNFDPTRSFDNNIEVILLLEELGYHVL